MSINIRFMVYNAFGIGGTVKTIFNFADFFQKTGKYNVEIISIKRTRDTPILHLNPKVKIIALQDMRRGAKYSDEDRFLLNQPSELIHKEEDLYMMFSAYTDKKMKSVLGEIHDGILVTTMPSFNMIATTLVDEKVLKIGQEHKSFADHTPGLQKLIHEYYGQLDALTILTERNKYIYERKIKGSVQIYVLGNGTERLPYRANLKNHIIVAAGRYAEEKGYDMLIKAFAMIVQDYPDWVVKIYGEGKLAKYYLKLIHEYGLEKQIILESGTDKMNEKFSEAAIHICSSYREGFGMSVIEGFAMGLPCISFACDGPREIITDGYDGLVVPKEDIRALATAMSQVMSDEEFRIELGKNAYETSKKYDIRVIGANFQKIVEQELEAKTKRIKEVPKNIINAEHENNCTNINDNCKIGKEIVDDGYSVNYSNLVNIASDGKIGLKVIFKMIRGWFMYKFHK